MTGPSTISLDKEVVFKCTSSPSKTPAKVHWKVTDSQGVVILNIIKNTNSSSSKADTGLLMTAYATLSTTHPLPMLNLECATTGEHRVLDTRTVETQCKYNFGFIK